MHSLFSKIFACFWLSHLIIVGLVWAILSASQEARDERPLEGRRGALTGADLARFARVAAQAPGENRAQTLAQIERESGLRAGLFDANGTLVAGQAPRGGERLASEALDSGEAEFRVGRSGLVSARRASAPNGAFQVLTLERERLGLRRRTTSVGPWELDRRQTLEAARLLAIFIAAGVVALGLARYLTGPTATLRRATHQLAEGDLSARVGPQMGRRRDELADLGRDFDLMAERIEGLLGAQRRLLGDISHELGSPLARLNVALELAEQSADAPTQKYLERIARESARLDSLIGQLLTITRLEGARPGVLNAAPGQTQSVDLARLVEDVCADADFEAQSGRRVQIVQTMPCRLEGNAELLRSAVENVVRNALLHAPESSQIEVSLQVVDEAPAASSTSESAPNASSTKPLAALIRVRDHGPGVPPEALGELFRPFYRVAEARDRQSGGVGLGLSITERATRFHGGIVSARNADDGGLIVEIRLPLARN